MPYKLKAAAEASAKDDSNDDKNMAILNRGMIELLRLNPQGEVLLRLASKDNADFGAPIRQGTLVFCSHGAAMRDGSVIANPLTFDTTRDLQAAKWARGLDVRAQELPQSKVYLHHGYGRHKCLGRYASEMTMEEGLRAVLLFDSFSRQSELKMDPQKLYAESLMLKLR